MQYTRRLAPRRFALATVAALTLAACGGGGGGDDGGDNVTGPALLEGLWETVATPGTDAGNLLALEDGSVWAVLANANTGSLETLFQGTVIINPTSVTSDLRVHDLGSGNSAAVPGVSTSLQNNVFTLNATVFGNATTLTSQRATNDAAYDYNRAAQLADLQGTWSGELSQGRTGNVTVQANGAFSATTSSGCTFTGTATPRGSGKNVFNVQVTFGAAPCATPNGSSSGVALAARATATESAAVLIMLTNGARTSAEVFLGIKP